MSKDLFCYLTQSAVVISHDEKVLPCCRFKPSTRDLAPSLSDLTQEDILLSDYYKKIRASFEDGIFPNGCQTCKSEEENGLISMRQRRGSKKTTDISLEELELFVGNKCNMKCIMCGPEFSSLWQKDAPGEIHFQEGVSTKKLEMLNITHLKSLRLLGGETLINKSFPEIVRWVTDNSDPTAIDFSLATNGSVGPSANLLNLLKVFKRVVLDFSIDGIGKLAEKIRPGVPWGVIEKSIENWMSIKEKHPQFKFNIHTTIQKDNLAYLDEVIALCKKLNTTWTFKVLEMPEELSIQRLSKWQIEESKSKLRNHSNAKDFVSYFETINRIDQWKFLTERIR